ncbi:MAG: polysaccharide deacetylase [Anaerocolumna sp.]|nr:polysaccharide deacetylase [Anaerocolumna sp.]
MKALNRIKKIGLAILVVLFTIATGCATGYRSKPYQYETSRNYDANKDIELAMKELGNIKEVSSIISGVRTVEKVAAITFDGMQDFKTTEKILKLLKKYNMKAVFFLPGIKSAEDPETVLNIVKHGQRIENYTLTADKYLEKETIEELVNDFCRTGNILEVITGNKPTLLKCNVTEYTQKLLKASKVSGLSEVVSSNLFLNGNSFKSYDQALDYVNTLPRGSVLSIKVDSALDSTEYDRVIDNEEESIDTPEVITPTPRTLLTPGISLAIQPQNEENKELIYVISILLKALSETGFKIVPVDEIKSYKDKDYDKDYVKERDANKGNLSEVITNGYITKAAISLNFSNIKNDNIYEILDLLDKYKLKATFFITGEEALEEQEKITLIINKGHLIENGGLSGHISRDMEFKDVCFEIYKGGKILKDKYGIHTTFYMPPMGLVDKTFREAASALGYKMTTYNKNPITGYRKTVKEVTEYFKNGFHRGDITYVNLGLHDNMALLTKQIIMLAKDQNFGFEPMDKLYKMQYTRRDLEDIPGWDAVRFSDSDKYIKNMSKRVITQIANKDKKVFLTFDDWGSDKTIDNILRILDNYGVKASFFIRVNGIEVNPNLLRAIDEKGHDIANHSYAHNIITELSTEELKKDIVKGHEILTQVLNRQPELFFRPPTLEFDNGAIRAILNTGFSYVVLGDISTHDYEATYQEVVNYVMDNITTGSIIVLHMSDNSSAGKALPLIIEKLRSKGYGFAKLSDYLK